MYLTDEQRRFLDLCPTGPAPRAALNFDEIIDAAAERPDELTEEVREAFCRRGSARFAAPGVAPIVRASHVSRATGAPLGGVGAVSVK
ncbi:MAG: hypothetical protein OXG69_02075 [bacterium]|nr:hypothetical protein [bacterium]